MKSGIHIINICITEALIQFDKSANALSGIRFIYFRIDN
jgi:hypothetical protein